ncbi:MAG: HAMP domain-containing histidine kinase, partial [Bacteroidales bacterium]|nr:HAMP domain-containing histidine kinase [Bacteroidales bacterium]
LGLSASALLIAYRSLKKQLALNEMRDDFISNISHELQTPVSTVKVALEALNTYDLKKDPKITGEYLEMASREVDRLGGLVGKVLNHSLLEDQSDWLQKEACDLHDMVQKIMKTMEITIREKGAEISLIPAEGPFMVLVDPVYVEGVIHNLIDNSLKYAGPEPEIEILLASGSSGVTLSVRDNGPGIPNEFKEQVFEKFFRITTGDRHDVKGYGLGLNFASQVMEQHHGSISQDNLPGGGCEFILHFSEELE